MNSSAENAPLLPRTSTGLARRYMAESGPTPFSERVGSVFRPLVALFRFIFGLWSWMEEKLLSLDNRFVTVLVQVLNCSPVNCLLPIVVVSFAICIFGSPSDGLKFGLNFIAIVPLAAILSYATEELADKLGPTWGGLANATFGNTVEAIVSIVALKNGQIDIVQQSMLGSILSNLLMVLGCCFLFSGIGVTEREFDASAAGNMYSLMLFACTAMVLPSVLAAVMSTEPGSNGIAGTTMSDSTLAKVLTQSRAMSVVMMLLYAIYLYYNLSATKEEQKPVEAIVEEGIAEYDPEVDGGDADALADAAISDANATQEHEEGLSIIESLLVLGITTVIISFAADFLVESIDGVVESGYMSKMFIGLILIPIVGNAAEHVSSCIVAVKGQMDLAVEIAIGSSIQIALFVTPLLVVIGAFISQPMTLHFQLFGTVALIFSVIVVGSLIQDGKSNALEGVMCLGIFALVSISCWVYPDELGSNGAGSLASVASTLIQ